ncbi:uncharacterized oxidoreductase YrpG-like [Hibiscus syriacus]|uniref:uncharacterized oxidoreductase YrpG-like n=1 Tax=Hibiscus syriacus TaxID=106335 RepID=UPI001923F3D1|nr:uncharacterized oxidoreductase YrpG-like [Hibiscus syriacus]
MSVPLFNIAPNLTVSRLCLGTMTFGEQNSLPQSFRLLDQAFEAGINFFDSAEMYPVPQCWDSRKSEEYFGRWVRQRNISRDRVVISTKDYSVLIDLCAVSRNSQQSEGIVFLGVSMCCFSIGILSSWPLEDSGSVSCGSPG